MKTFLNHQNKEDGFTFIELIMVITLIGVLTSIAAEKLTDVAERTELTAEAATIEVLRSSLIINFGNDMINGIAAKFPANPFARLHKVPGGYDRNRNSPPTGTDEEEDLWVFVPGGVSVTPEQTGTTLEGFKSTGSVFHQRKDGTVVKWAYDSNIGIIGKRQ